MPVKPTKSNSSKTAKLSAKPVSKPTTKAATSAKVTSKAVAKKPIPAKPATKLAIKPAKTPLQKAALKAAPKKLVINKPALKKPAAKKSVRKKPVAAKAAKIIDPIEQIARTVATTLDTNKAEQIVTISLAGRSSLADWMVIASGKSSRQVGALANYVQRALTEAGCKRVRIEGMPQGDWVVIDSGDVVIHIFRPEVRDYYQLERLWAEDEGEPAQTRTLR